MNVGLLTSVSAIALVGYVGVVMYQGNLLPFLQQVGKDWEFLEWVAAIGLLYWLVKNEYLSGPVSALVGIALIAMLLKLTANPTVTSAVNSFGQGNLSLLSTLEAIGVQAGKTFGTAKVTANNWSPTTGPLGALPGMQQ